MSWSPVPVQEPEPVTLGRGPTYKAVGPTFKNLVTEERHYSIKEIATLWNISEDLVRDTFAREKGVLKFERPATRMKRSYSLLRVPHSVLERVHRRITERR